MADAIPSGFPLLHHFGNPDYTTDSGLALRPGGTCCSKPHNVDSFPFHYDASQRIGLFMQCLEVCCWSHLSLLTPPSRDSSSALNIHVKFGKASMLGSGGWGSPRVAGLYYFLPNYFLKEFLEVLCRNLWNYLVRKRNNKCISHKASPKIIQFPRTSSYSCYSLMSWVL